MKKIIGILTAMVLSVCAVQLAAAENDITCSLDCIPGTVIMKGSIEIPGLEYPSAVTVKVTDSENHLNYYDVIYTDDQNKAEFYYKNNASSGIYTCVFGINAIHESVTATYADFKGKDFQDEFVVNVKSAVKNNDTEQIEKLITENDDWLKTDRSVFEGLKESGKVYSLMISDYEEYQEACDVKNAFEKCAMLENVNENGAAGLKILYESDQDKRLFQLVDKIPSNGGENAFDSLSDSTKNSIYAAASGTYTMSSQLVETFVSQTLLTAIHKAANYNEVKIVLEAYKAAGKIRYSYTLGTADYKALIGKSFNSYSAVEAAIASLKNTSKTPGGGGGGGGGGFSSSNAPLRVETEITPPSETNDGKTTEAHPINKYFDDIEDSKWAMEAVDFLYEKGIISGSGERTFDPNRSVTRSEAAKMITLLAGVEMENTVPKAFSDAVPDAWYEKYINAACEYGYFEGYGDGSFGVSHPITREQAATVIYRLLTGKNMKFVKNGFIFEDDAAISDWAKDAVYSLHSGEIINGRSNNRFYPAENMTRAECAVLIYRAAQQMGGI